MDLLKELQDVRKAIQDALQDKELSLFEIVRILKEVIDVFVLLLPIVLSTIGRAEAQERTKAIQASGEGTQPGSADTTV